MRSIIIISLILACTLSNAQDRKDTIRMKDGTEILCQLLKVSEPDSIIQFCIRENGELKVKKVQTAFVDSYSWPGKEQAAKYSKMLGAKNIQDGEIYKGYCYIKPPSPQHELTSTEMAARELNKAKTLVTISFAVISTGLVTAILIPKLITTPSMHGDYWYIDPEDAKRYDNTIKALHIGGYGIAVAGAAIGFSALNHLTKANLLRQESGKGLSLASGRDGLSLVLTF
ncbi:MAG: hypothetical protein Q7U54_01330 [Bacteroidales bacterium]|nr:hypothetical protein [Bacteroidales bacterium]